MIQRIQTVFLALIVLLFVLFFFIPVLEFTPVNGGETTMIPFAKMPLLLAGEVLLALVALITIFLYKTRKRQAKIAQLGLLLSLLLFAGVAAFPKVFSGEISETHQMHVTVFGIGTWLLLANPVLFFLAARSIKKDEELVRSADRLR